MQVLLLTLIRIKPDWNVNNFLIFIILSMQCIRIKPDWNVNKIIGMAFGSGGVDQNKTRLECKAYKILR